MQEKNDCGFAVFQELKIKSSHDVLKEDPRLSSQPAVDPSEMG